MPGDVKVGVKGKTPKGKKDMSKELAKVVAAGAKKPAQMFTQEQLKLFQVQ